MAYQIHFAKESFKFSCTHFTIFGADRAERMHGHNYRVRVSLSLSAVDPRRGMAFDFNEIKPQIRAACEYLDEYILVPERNEWLSVQTSENQVELRFGRKRYSLPQDDVRLIPVVNVTCEELARYLASQIEAAVRRHSEVEALTVTVEETAGQSVDFTLRLASRAP